MQVSTATERVVSKLFSFPPLLALLLAAVVALSGVPLPAEVAAVTSYLAAAHRPLVLMGLGLMVPLSLPRNQTRILLALLGAPPFSLRHALVYQEHCSRVRLDTPAERRRPACTRKVQRRRAWV